MFRRLSACRKTKILSISSNRADVGILFNIWRLIALSQDFELHVILTGTHFSDVRFVTKSIPDGAHIHTGGADITGNSGCELEEKLSEIGRFTARTHQKVLPDFILIVGDRLEMLSVAASLVAFNTPMLHIAGGDLTEGAVDDRVRHALTKLSHVHFVTSKHSARRVHQMGEELWRVKLVGAPNLDTLKSVKVLSQQELQQQIGIGPIEHLRLVTVHPETNNVNFDAPLGPVLRALDTNPAPTLITAPNADPGSDVMEAVLREFSDKRDWVAYRKNLGSQLYANVMKRAKMMIGNSSSGIIEAGLFGLPVINVGDRQAGREHGDNVFHCRNDLNEISSAIQKFDMSPKPQFKKHIYGDGKSADRIVNIMRKLPERGQLIKKSFAVPDDAQFVEQW